MSGTYYSEKKILDRLFGAATLTPPSTWYLGLSTTIPNESGTGITEPVGKGYSRVPIANNGTNFGYNTGTGAVNGETRNLVWINFPMSTEAWGEMRCLLFFDAATNGNLWFFNESAPRYVDVNSIVGYMLGTVVIRQRNTV